MYYHTSERLNDDDVDILQNLLITSKLRELLQQ